MAEILRSYILAGKPIKALMGRDLKAYSTIARRLLFARVIRLKSQDFSNNTFKIELSLHYKSGTHTTKTVTRTQASSVTSWILIEDYVASGHAPKRHTPHTNNLTTSVGTSSSPAATTRPPIIGVYAYWKWYGNISKLVGKKLKVLPGFKAAANFLDPKVTVRYVEIKSLTSNHVIEAIIHTNINKLQAFYILKLHDKILDCISLDEYTSIKTSSSPATNPTIGSIYDYWKKGGLGQKFIGKKLKPFPTLNAMLNYVQVDYIEVKDFNIIRDTIDVILFGKSLAPKQITVFSFYKDSNILNCISTEEYAVASSEVPSMISLKGLQKANETNEACIRCGNPTQPINLTFKIVTGCLNCEKELMV